MNRLTQPPAGGSFPLRSRPRLQSYTVGHSTPPVGVPRADLPPGSPHHHVARARPARGPASQEGARGTRLREARWQRRLPGWGRCGVSGAGLSLLPRTVTAPRPQPTPRGTAAPTGPDAPQERPTEPPTVPRGPHAALRGLKATPHDYSSAPPPGGAAITPAALPTPRSLPGPSRRVEPPPAPRRTPGPAPPRTHSSAIAPGEAAHRHALRTRRRSPAPPRCPAPRAPSLKSPAPPRGRRWALGREGAREPSFPRGSSGLAVCFPHCCPDSSVKEALAPSGCGKGAGDICRRRRRAEQAYLHPACSGRCVPSAGGGPQAQCGLRRATRPRAVCPGAAAHSVVQPRSRRPPSVCGNGAGAVQPKDSCSSQQGHGPLLGKGGAARQEAAVRCGRPRCSAWLGAGAGLRPGAPFHSCTSSLAPSFPSTQPAALQKGAWGTCGSLARK